MFRSCLRDKFLCDLKSSTIPSNLLSESGTLKFDKVVQLPLLTENEENNAKTLHPDDSRNINTEIDFVRPRYPNSYRKVSVRTVRMKKG